MLKSKLKCLLITFFDVKGLVHYEFLPEGQTINQHYFLDVLRRSREAVRQKRPEKWHQKNWPLHHDNARPHTAVTIYKLDPLICLSGDKKEDQIRHIIDCIDIDELYSSPADTIKLYKLDTLICLSGDKKDEDQIETSLTKIRKDNPSAKLTATGSVPRWWIGEQPSDMKASCETNRITLMNKQSWTKSSIVRKEEKNSLKILSSTDPVDRPQQGSLLQGLGRSCVCTHVRVGSKGFHVRNGLKLQVKIVFMTSRRVKNREDNDFTAPGHQLDFLTDPSTFLAILGGKEIDYTQSRVTLSKKFYCFYCNFRTRSSSRWMQHHSMYHPDFPLYSKEPRNNIHNYTYTRSNRRLYVCPSCKFTTSKLVAIVTHQIIHKEEVPYACLFCLNFEARDTLTLATHLHSHTADKIYRCPICTFKCCEPNDLTNHMQDHAEKTTYICPQCPYSTTFKRLLSHHVHMHDVRSKASITKHKIEIDLRVCPFCDFSTADPSAFAKHRRSHVELEKPYPCPSCEFRAADIDSLFVHKQSHQNWETYFDPLYSKEIDYTQSRVTLSKKFYCFYCNFRTRSSSRWMQHHSMYHPDFPLYSKEPRNNIHNYTYTRSNRRLYVCPSCKFTTSKLVAIVTHQIIHKEEVPYACLFCLNFEARDTLTLATHLHSHTADKIYRCPICTFKCCEPNDLTNHMQDHAEKTTYICPQCPYSTTFKRLLSHHVHMHDVRSKASITKHKIEIDLRVCPFCDFSTADPSAFAKHRRSHVELEKPYPCPSCEFRAADIDSLFVHKQSHQNWETYFDPLYIYKSELSAIDTALKDININLPSKIIIYSDSRAAIYTLQSCFSSQEPLLKRIAKSVNRLPANSSVTVQWLPAHVGIPGNELADSLAKAGVLGLPEARESTTQLDERDLLRTIKTQCLQEWKSDAAHDWYRAGGTSTGSVLPREQQSLISRLKSGHLQTMTFQNGCRVFPLCTKCNSRPATPRHIIHCIDSSIDELYSSPADTINKLYKLDTLVIWLLLMISGIEPNPGPKKQTTLLTEPTPTGKKSADTELKTMIVQMSSEIRNLGERIDTRLSNIEKRIIEWDQRLLGVEMKLTTCVETSAATNEKVSENVTKLREIEARTDFLEMKLREPNLVFYGVEGEANEGPAESLQKVKSIIKEKMLILENISITKCHRLGKANKSPILISLPEYEDRIKLFKNTTKLRDSKIYISKDYSKKIRDQRLILIAKRKELFEKGTRSKLRDNKLFVKGVVYEAVNGQVVNTNGNKI
ncbi:hypothetical protein LAZ67_9003047 [Cordylochernes scorpioides]|uniref:Uncharacterized protein n=1 Tax=Cordylochernes scorpioides TaxID=51811 RepID=A0ABY6KU71_9ARAC|nr:hypothetical protein LAZ67_9003047 [Cordylochernes scorpioides]